MTTTSIAPNWRLAAACRDEGTEIFYLPTSGRGGGKALVDFIISIYCNRCTVEAECLADDLRLPSKHRHGIRGGYTDTERRKMPTLGARP